MTEGLLQKKIRRRLGFVYTDKSMSHTCTKENLKIILEIIGLARKEFPILDTSGSLVSAVRFAIEVNIWKKKFFGEEAKEVQE